MASTAIATILLGRRVRLHGRAGDAKVCEGTIVCVYLDDGLHYVIMVDGRLVDVADASQFIVMPETEW